MAGFPPSISNSGIIVSIAISKTVLSKWSLPAAWQMYKEKNNFKNSKWTKNMSTQGHDKGRVSIWWYWYDKYLDVVTYYSSRMNIVFQPSLIPVG